MSHGCVVAIGVGLLLAAAGAAMAQPSTISPDTPPSQRVPPFLPVVPQLPPTPTPGVQTPTPAARPGQFSPPPNYIGPVTGYGTGGMQQPPGSGPNPPYPPGGLMH